MAVPFALPDDDDNHAAVEQIFNHIHELLRLLQQQIQSRQAREEVGASTRVRSTSSSRRSRDHRSHQQLSTTLSESNRLPSEIVNLPALLTTLRGSSSDLERVQLAATRRRRRMRTSSESSCCEDGKPLVIKSSVDVGVTVHWTQEEEQAREQQTKGSSSCCGSEGLLSKLVPPPISGSIWTAVICVVGWHLLRTR